MIKIRFQFACSKIFVEKQDILLFSSNFLTLFGRDIIICFVMAFFMKIDRDQFLREYCLFL